MVVRSKKTRPSRLEKHASQVNFNKKVRCYVTKQMIEDAKCGDPNKCMIKLAVAKGINGPGLYIKVDSTGVAITRRNDRREKAFLPRVVVNNMVRFDNNKESVTPFSFTLHFIPTTRVSKSSAERKAQVNAARRKRKENGRPDKKYDLHTRVKGLAVSPQLLEEVG